jgi:hypothetical protein
MPQTYYLRNTASDLTWGEDFDYKLLTSTAVEATSVISFAKSATETSFGYTDLGVPDNADWETGTFVVKVKVTAENTNIWGSIRVDRISASGATVESSTTTAEQQFSSIATYTFTVASKDWTAGTSGDRIAVAYIFRNAKNSVQTVTISFNTSDSSVVTSVTTIGTGGTTKSLQYRVIAPHSTTKELTYRIYHVLQTPLGYSIKAPKLSQKTLKYSVKHAVTTSILDLEYKIPQVRLGLKYSVIGLPCLVPSGAIAIESITSVATTEWVPPYVIKELKYLVVGGGADSGSADQGGGGGGGQVLEGTLSNISTTQTVRIAGFRRLGSGLDGDYSQFGSIVAAGGKKGTSNSGAGGNSGSGKTGGTPLSQKGGGGAGDSANGSNASGSYAGNGGAGTQSVLTGSYYGGGGGGGAYTLGYAGTGGTGGGGDGGSGAGGYGLDQGGFNTGGGSGGMGEGVISGGSGASSANGIVVLQYHTPYFNLQYVMNPAGVYTQHINTTLQYAIKSTLKTTYTLRYTVVKTKTLATKDLTYRIKHILPYTLQYWVKPITKKTLQFRVKATKRRSKNLSYAIVRLLTTSLMYKIKRSYQDWAYDTITIMNPVAINNFQHKLDLTWHPTINTDFSDLRFMQLDLTDCPYYIDAHTLVPGVSCTVWIKVPTANQTELKMYHCGDPTIVSASDGDTTFEFFDDFLGTSLDSGKWTYLHYTGSDSCTVAGSVLSLYAWGTQGAFVYPNHSNLSAATPVVSEFSAIMGNGTGPHYTLLGPCETYRESYIEDIVTGAAIGTSSGALSGMDYYIWDADRTYGYYFNETITHEFKLVSSGTNNTNVDYYVDNVYKATHTTVFAPHVELASWSGGTLQIDWVRVRKYASTEPTLTVTKRQLGKFLKYVVRNHAPVKTLSLYYVCAHNLVTTQYNLKYGIYHTCASPTRSLSYAIPHIEIVAEPSSGSTIPLNVTCHTTIESNVFSKWTWTWDFDGDLGSSMVGATGSINHQFINYGEYDITCTASTTNASATATTHVSIVESTIPFPEFYFYIHPGTYKVDFFNYSSGAVSYDWNFGDGTAHSIETNPTHTYASDDVYTVTLIATNGVGPNTKIKEVQFTFDPPVADFELEYTPPLRFLPQVAVTLTVTDTLGRSDDITKYLYVAPGPFTRFKDLSTGKIKYWEWNFGDE